MNGTVDDDLRALLEVQIGTGPNGGKSTVLAWVDTAFTRSPDSIVHGQHA